ncbi:hypothetical protein [Curtobacterium flaccumfaciens]|uniref:hypothetical protein n=1 Tax=Curtobacterium flaccumfaciens TaxID=2035 RepID=UPI001BE0AF1C|nr:hypothetical protein [Curtobacterium flaccumfaciens]MBT1584127.1 hypothetical protein [Curtobacterium flaccumfaciens pv. flaccumfaciens]MCS5493622.1 hypothetical protein [Curtobacterium flaccumfaciens pv. flaccumfaciens]MCX2797199.1 hypothetical protein [Curtobacterium flaccumfaciens pv. flaccumfaciens]
MASNDELRRIPGIRAVSSFYSNFGGEDVVVRPSKPGEPAFRIEVLLNSDGKAIFPPAAPVHEGDLVEREDPRGGVIEYTIDQYQFSKDPFSGGNDHWDAHLVENRHVARRFAEPHILIQGGVNQFAVGDGNTLQFVNQAAAFPDVVNALGEIRDSMPRKDLTSDQVAEIDDALKDAAAVAGGAVKPSVLKRALHGVNGVLGDVAHSVKDGGADGVKAWVAAATAMLLSQIASLQ